LSKLLKRKHCDKVLKKKPAAETASAAIRSEFVLGSGCVREEGAARGRSPVSPGGRGEGAAVPPPGTREGRLPGAGLLPGSLLSVCASRQRQLGSPRLFLSGPVNKQTNGSGPLGQELRFLNLPPK